MNDEKMLPGKIGFCVRSGGGVGTDPGPGVLWAGGAEWKTVPRSTALGCGGRAGQGLSGSVCKS